MQIPIVVESLAAGLDRASTERAAEQQSDNPWVKFAGHLADEPLLDEWRAAIAEYRQWRESIDEQGSRVKNWGNK